MVRGCWPCRGWSGSRGFESRGGMSCSSQSFSLVDDVVHTLLDDHAPTPSLGDDLNPVVLPEGDGYAT